MTPYPQLFTPIKIGGQLIKNRIFSAPTGLMSYTARGHLTTENMAYYELKAKGGYGVVTLGESIVHAATGQSHDRQICCLLSTSGSLINLPVVDNSEAGKALGIAEEDVDSGGKVGDEPQLCLLYTSFQGGGRDV